MLARVHIQTLNYDMIIIQHALFRLLISLLATWPVNIHAESRNNTYVETTFLAMINMNTPMMIHLWNTASLISPVHIIIKS